MPVLTLSCLFLEQVITLSRHFNSIFPLLLRDEQLFRFRVSQRPLSPPAVVGIPMLGCFIFHCLQTAVFQWKLLHYGTGNWQERQRQHFAKTALQAKVKSASFIAQETHKGEVLSLNHLSQGMSLARCFHPFCGHQDLYGIIWSVPLTRRRFALFSGLDSGSGLLGSFKCFEVLMSSKTYQA